MISHISEQEWIDYIQGRLSSSRQEGIETYLYSSDEALTTYMNYLEKHAEQLPELDDDVDFTDNIIASIPTMTEETVDFVSKSKEKSKSFYQQSIFHYGVAAVVTLTLMTSGFFGQLLGFRTQIENTALAENNQSISEGLMNQTISWLDALDQIQKEGNE